jgi:hypothetical protein
MLQTECVPVPASGSARARLRLHHDKAGKRNRADGYNR